MHDVRLFAEILYKLIAHIVDLTCAETAAERKDKRRFVRKTEFTANRFPVRSEHLKLYGISREDELFLVFEALT